MTRSERPSGIENEAYAAVLPGRRKLGPWDVPRWATGTMLSLDASPSRVAVPASVMNSHARASGVARHVVRGSSRAAPSVSAATWSTTTTGTELKPRHRSAGSHPTTMDERQGAVHDETTRATPGPRPHRPSLSVSVLGRAAGVTANAVVSHQRIIGQQRSGRKPTRLLRPWNDLLFQLSDNSSEMVRFMRERSILVQKFRASRLRGPLHPRRNSRMSAANAASV